MKDKQEFIDAMDIQQDDNGHWHIHGIVLGDVLGSVLGSVWGTINGREWKYVEEEV